MTGQQQFSIGKQEEAAGCPPKKFMNSAPGGRGAGGSPWCTLVAANGGWGLPCSLKATSEDGTYHTSDSEDWKSATGLGIGRE